MADLADRAAGDRLVEQAWAFWNGLDAWLQIAGADTLTGPNCQLAFDAKLDLLWSVDVAATIRLCRVGRKMRRRDMARSSRWAGTRSRPAWREIPASSSRRPRAPSWPSPAAWRSALPRRCGSMPWLPAGSRPLGADGLNRLAGSGPPRDPPGPLGHPRRCRRVAWFLVSPAAEFVTGQVMRINGGGDSLSRISISGRPVPNAYRARLASHQPSNATATTASPDRIQGRYS